MTKHDCENYATCANYAPKQPKAPEHVAGERCDAPVRCGYENDSIDHFEYTGEYGTAYNTWFLCFIGEIVYAHISFPDVWILRPVPKADTKAAKDARLARECLEQKWWAIARGDIPDYWECALCSAYKFDCADCPMNDDDGSRADCCDEWSAWSNGGKTAELAIPVVRRLERIAGIAEKDSPIQPKAKPKFKVGDHAWWDGRSNCFSSHGPAQRVKVVAVNREYCIRYTSGTHTGECYVPYNALTPDTRPRIKVTAIDKTSKLHKWHFYGEPDWKRIEREVYEVGIAGVVDVGVDGVAPKGGKFMGDGYVAFTKNENILRGWIYGDWGNMYLSWRSRGCGIKEDIAALRDRIRQHYGKQEPTITTNAQGTKYVRADLPDKCDACAHEFAPKPAFKVGDWVAYDSVGAPFQYNDRYETHTVGLRPARLSDFEREVNGVRVLMRENDSGTYELTLPRSSLHDSEAIIGYWVEIKAKGGAYQLAKALGLTIAPASVKE